MTGRNLYFQTTAAPYTPYNNIPWFMINRQGMAITIPPPPSTTAPSWVWVDQSNMQLNLAGGYGAGGPDNPAVTCAVNHCKNGGSCRLDPNVDGQIVCSCGQGFFGLLCETGQLKVR